MNGQSVVQKWLICFQWGSTLAGLAFLVVAVSVSAYEWNFLRHASHATAVVSQFDEQLDTDRTPATVAYAPVFTFEIAGTTHVVHSGNGSNPRSFELGQRVPVLYDSTHPDHAQINSFGQEWGLALGFAIGGIAASTIGWAIYWMRLRTQRASFRPRSVEGGERFS